MLDVCASATVASVKAQVAALEGFEASTLSFGGALLSDDTTLEACGVSALNTLDLTVALAGGKQHGSLTQAGRVKGRTPKVEKMEKKKPKTGRCKVRLQCLVGCVRCLGVCVRVCVRVLCVLGGQGVVGLLLGTMRAGGVRDWHCAGDCRGWRWSTLTGEGCVGHDAFLLHRMSGSRENGGERGRERERERAGARVGHAHTCVVGGGERVCSRDWQLTCACTNDGWRVNVCECVMCILSAGVHTRLDGGCWRGSVCPCVLVTASQPVQPPFRQRRRRLWWQGQGPVS